MATTADRSEPYTPLTGVATDGWSKEDEAIATCFCGEIRLAFSTQGHGLIATLVCNCTDCRKITASLFASNFIIADTHLKHLHGEEKLSSWGQSSIVANGNKMTSYFSSTWGTLMYRRGSAFPGQSIMRIGTVDDFIVQENKLRPRFEQFIEDRVSWFPGSKGLRQLRAFIHGRMP